MKLSLNWLRSYINILEGSAHESVCYKVSDECYHKCEDDKDLNLNKIFFANKKTCCDDGLNNINCARNVCDVLSAIGFESEIHAKIPDLSCYKICHVRNVTKHENADKLSVCEVFDGKDVLQIVCGAKNVRQNMIAILAPVGCIMPSGFEIKEAKLRGVVSQGMLCSYEEIGLSNWFKLDGIADLGTMIDGQSILYDFYENDCVHGVDDISDNLMCKDNIIGQNLAELKNFMQAVSDIIDIQFTHNRKNSANILEIAIEYMALIKARIWMNNCACAISDAYGKGISGSGCCRSDEISSHDCINIASRFDLSENNHSYLEAEFSKQYHIFNKHSLKVWSLICDYYANQVLKMGFFDLIKQGDGCMLVCEMKENFVLPLWVKSKLDSSDIKYESSLHALSDYISLELGVKFIVSIRDNLCIFSLPNDMISNMRDNFFQNSTSDQNHIISANHISWNIIILSIMKLFILIKSTNLGKIESIIYDLQLMSSDYYKNAEILLRNTNELGFLSKRKIILHYDKIVKFLRQSINYQFICNTLVNLGFGVESISNKLFVVIVPIHRLHDVEIEEDLIEEIVRIYGINNIPSDPLLYYKIYNKNMLVSYENDHSKDCIKDDSSSDKYCDMKNYDIKGNTSCDDKSHNIANGLNDRLHEKTFLPIDLHNKDGIFFYDFDFFMFFKKLCASMGYYEIITWSFIPCDVALRLSSDVVKIVNPISRDMSIMRPSLLHGLLNTLAYHQNSSIEVRGLFELGAIYSDRSAHNQSFVLSGLLVLDKSAWVNDVDRNISTIKSHIVSLLTISGVNKLSIHFQSSENDLINGAVVYVNQDIVGYVGRVNKNFLKCYDIRVNFAVFELNVLSVVRAISQRKIDMCSGYQAIERDFSFEIDRSINVDLLVRDIIHSLEGHFVNENISIDTKLFDVFEKSKCDKVYFIGIKFVFRLSTRTFNDDDSVQIHKIIVSEAANRGAILRLDIVN